jgi:hypothetical protein
MAVGHGGLYHSQSPEGFFLGAHGLKVRRSNFIHLPLTCPDRDTTLPNPS